MRGIRYAGVFSLLLAACVAVFGCRRHGEHEVLSDRTKTGRLAPELKNLGAFERRISTQSPDAQRFFTQGLVLVYGFNHAEALRSFQEAARLDPGCGMMHWGQALALAPNINDPAIGPDRERQGYQAISRALELRAGLSPVEAGLIEALAARFTGDKPDRAQLNQAYAGAMAKLYARFPGDPDVATLYADAVMNTMPWDYWTKDGKPRPGTLDALAALEEAIRTSPDHPGAHHLYIHAVEASTDPDRGVRSAEKLGALVPAAGHLVHMPSHIFIRVGRYSDAADANIKAIAADEDYITQCRAQGIYPAAYYPHNIHFLFVALSMEGRSREAMEAARKVATRHEHKDLLEPGFGFAHLLRAMPYLAMVRFGRWEEMLAQPDPGAASSFVQAVWHYGRGMALSARGDLGAAQAELGALARLARAPELEQLKIFELNSLARLAAIAEALLDGEIAAARKDTRRAISALRRAVELEDQLLYSEPPDWPLSPRHYLGAALLEFGRAKEAEACFWEDLTRHRRNGWALRGLQRSLELQGRKAEAARVEADFEKAWARADVKIGSSRL
jgi:tetratricopeptide (TPR) repeat protein